MGNQTFIEYNSSTAIVRLPHYKCIDKVLRSSSFEESYNL